MKIKKTAICGTLESSDVMITVTENEKNPQSIEVDLNSSVEKQFGDEIRALILKTAEDLGVTGVTIQANDKGALNCTIKARVKTAIFRACEEQQFGGGQHG